MVLSLSCLLVLINWSDRAVTRSAPLPTADLRPELVLQTGHTLKVNCVVFGPDGLWLASGGADNSIKIWDVTTGRELRSLPGHTGWVNALAVSRDGRWLASGSNDRSVRIWDVTSGQELQILTGHSGAVVSLAFSADGRLLASGSADNSVRLWDLQAGRERQILKGHTGWVTSLAFSNDGKLLASGGADRLIKLWDTASGRERDKLSQHNDRLTALAFSLDDEFLASASADGKVCQSRIGSIQTCFAGKPNGSAVVALSLIGGTLKSAGADGSITFWDGKLGKEKRTALSAGDEPNIMTGAAFSADGNVIATTTGNRTVSLLSGETGKLLRTLESRSTGFYAVAASSDGKWLASGSNDRSVRLWQTSTGRELPRLSGSSGWITSISFSPDNRLIASGSLSGEVKVWDLRGGREAYSLATDLGSINAVSFSHDNKWLAAAGVQHKIKIWDVATKTSRVLTGHAGEITGISFSPEGNLLASSSTDKTIRMWDPVSGQALKILANLPDQVNAVSFSPDGKSLAAAGADKTITIWDISSGQLLKSLRGHNGEILSLAYSADGKLLMSGSSDHSARIWDSVSGSELHSLAQGSGNVNSVSFGNDGSWVLAGDDDGRMTVSDAATGDLMVTLVSMRDKDEWLAVTPEGLFDGSPSSWQLLLWRFARNTFAVSPVESFFNEFFYPGLLADVLKGAKPKPARDITQKDRRQPQITLTMDVPATTLTKRDVTLKLKVAEAGSDGEHPQGSGARDVRLFRNGVLVRLWSGDVLAGRAAQELNATVPVVAGENRFTAYAFNRDNVKSSDVVLPVQGAESLRRSGTAYVIAIGVGRYQNDQYNLKYSVADALAMGEQWNQQQQSLGRYKPVEIISLLNEEATKANIMLALKRLAGTNVGALAADTPASLARIRPAQPEDAVLIYFSGHGTARGDRFFLIPHDLGYQGERAQLNTSDLEGICAHSISDLEIEEVLKPLDAEQLLLVIDACNSGQALEANEKRRGPMNTRGLAQLAYEKGMYVLTASQSIEVAFESEALKHSYLAYALLEEGIKSGSADADRDGQVLLDEWFDYATERVPRMGKDTRSGSKELIEVDPDERRVQRPRAFYSAKAGGQQLVIARLAGHNTQ